jgi:probable F420-dependent oxidoreductase
MRALGLGTTSSEELEDGVRLLRRLFHGERVTNYSGPLGEFPSLQLDSGFDEDIPFGITAFGPKTLELAGRVFDGVVLHTFFSDETVDRSVRMVRDAAERAGRDPKSVRIWSVLATVGDHLPAETRQMKTVGRLATYLQLYGDLLVRTNHWDPSVLERFRADEMVSTFPGWIDQGATPAQLDHIAELIPHEWLAAAADGSAEQCAETIEGQLALGADSVILHGATPSELEPVITAYRHQVHGARRQLPTNPGRTASERS